MCVCCLKVAACVSPSMCYESFFWQLCSVFEVPANQNDTEIHLTVHCSLVCSSVGLSVLLCFCWHHLPSYCVECFKLSTLSQVTCRDHLCRGIFLPVWTELSRKYLELDKSVFRGVVHDSIYDVTA